VAYLLDCCGSLLQPYAWEAREFLRKKLIGKEVSFTVEYKAPGTGKEYGFLYIGKGIDHIVQYILCGYSLISFIAFILL